MTDQSDQTHEADVSESAGITEEEIDEALEESFPASDPPPWTLGIEPHPHDSDSDEKK